MNPLPVIRGPYRRQPGRKPTHNVRGTERRWRAGKLDGRRLETHQINALADDFAADAGGWPNLSNRAVALVHTAAFAAWVCQQTACWALTQDGGIIAPDGSVPAALGKMFIAYANTLSRTLQALGLHPEQGDRMPTLQEYLAGKAQNAAADDDPKPTASATTATVPEPSPAAGDAAEATP
jgi:hypothetical protein